MLIGFIDWLNQDISNQVVQNVVGWATNENMQQIGDKLIRYYFRYEIRVEYDESSGQLEILSG